MWEAEMKHWFAGTSAGHINIKKTKQNKNKKSRGHSFMKCKLIQVKSSFMRLFLTAEHEMKCKVLVE